MASNYGSKRFATMSEREEGADERSEEPMAKQETELEKLEQEIQSLLEQYRAEKDPEKKYRAYPYGERGWEVAIDGGEALIGSETSASYSGIADHERIDLVAFQKDLEEVCSDVSRIWVHGLYRAEMPRP